MSRENHLKKCGKNIATPRVWRKRMEPRNCGVNIWFWWLSHLSEKYDFVNGKDDIPSMKWKVIKVMFETTTSHLWNGKIIQNNPFMFQTTNRCMILYHIIPYYTILYHIIPYYTIVPFYWHITTTNQSFVTLGAGVDLHTGMPQIFGAPKSNHVPWNATGKITIVHR